MSSPILYHRLDTKTWTVTAEQASVEDFKVRVGGHGFLFDEFGRLLLTKFGKRGLYDIPGGGVEPCESVPDACKREFIEETGLTVSVGEVIAVSERFFSFNDQPPLHSIRIHYKVHLLGGTLLVNGNGDDSVGCVWIHPEEVNETNTIPPVLDALRQLSNYQKI